MEAPGTGENAGGAASGFRFHLMTADGTVVGVHERATPLRRGDVVTLDATEGRWRVIATLGHVARVELLGEARDHGRIRVSVSSEEAARSFAETLGGGAMAACTPHGWVVSLPLAGESRVGTLARVASASRAVIDTYPDAELFVLDGERPIRLPPAL